MASGTLAVEGPANAYRSRPSKATQSQVLRIGAVEVNVRRKRLMIRIACHSSVLALLFFLSLLMLAIGAESVACLLFIIFLGYLITIPINPIPKLVEVRAIQEAVCLDCGEMMDLVGVYSCGCGYLSWQPRHAFLPCVNCKRTFAWLVCGRCEASIVI